MRLSVVILAAGQGKRMRSALPKVLHRLGGKPLLEHAYRAARDLRPEQVYVVYGHGGEQVRDALGYLGVQWIEQDRQLGTGHAVAQVLPFIESGSIRATRSSSFMAMSRSSPRRPSTASSRHPTAGACRC